MKVSIIIPIFNLEKYISKTIQSVINQTFSDLEIILVDDGSSDASLEICKKFQEIDSRIKLLHQENCGVSAARNNGLEIASGDYFMFVDGDDIVNTDIVKVLVEDCANTCCDIASCSLGHFADYNQADEIANFKWINLAKPMVESGTDAIKELLKGGSCTACCRLYKMSLFKCVRFVEGRKYNEDKFFYFQCLMKSSLVSKRLENLYFQFDRNNSSSKGQYSFDSVHISQLILESFEGEKEEMYSIALINDLLTSINNLHNLFRLELPKNTSKKTAFNVLKNRILAHCKKTWKQIPAKYRIEKFFIRLGFSTYYVFIHIFFLVNKG